MTEIDVTRISELARTVGEANDKGFDNLTEKEQFEAWESLLELSDKHLTNAIIRVQELEKVYEHWFSILQKMQELGAIAEMYCKESTKENKEALVGALRKAGYLK